MTQPEPARERSICPACRENAHRGCSLLDGDPPCDCKCEPARQSRQRDDSAPASAASSTPITDLYRRQTIRAGEGANAMTNALRALGARNAAREAPNPTPPAPPANLDEGLIAAIRADVRIVALVARPEAVELPSADLPDWNRLRQWLRYHPNDKVTVDPWGIYGTVVLTVVRNGKQVFMDWGESLDKRCANALAYLEAADQAEASTP